MQLNFFMQKKKKANFQILYMYKLYNSDFQKGVTKMVAQQPPSLAPPAVVGNDARKILWNILEYSGILKEYSVVIKYLKIPTAIILCFL